MQVPALTPTRPASPAPAPRSRAQGPALSSGLGLFPRWTLVSGAALRSVFRGGREGRRSLLLTED